MQLTEKFLSDDEQERQRARFLEELVQEQTKAFDPREALLSQLDRDRKRELERAAAARFAKTKR